MRLFISLLLLVCLSSMTGSSFAQSQPANRLKSNDLLEGFRKEVVANLGEKEAKEQLGKVDGRRAFITYVKTFGKSCKNCPVAKGLAQSLALPANEPQASWADSSWNPFNPKFWLPGKVSWCPPDPKTGCDCLTGLNYQTKRIDCNGVPGGGATTPIPPTTNEEPKDEDDDSVSTQVD